MTRPTPEIIGLTGTMSGGKDTLALQLEKQFGFLHISTSDLVRKEAQRLRGSIERPVLKEVATLLRTEQGADVFVQQALDMWRKTDSGKLVITGIRALPEAQLIHDEGGKIVYVDADFDDRYQWMVARQRDDESKISKADFRQRDELEQYAGPNPADHNLRAIKKIANLVIWNDYPDSATFLEESYKKLGLVA